MISETAGASSAGPGSTPATAAPLLPVSDSSLPEQIVERQRVQKANYGVLQALGASASNLFHTPNPSSSSTSSSATAPVNSFLPPSSFHVPTVMSSVSPASTASAAPTPILVALNNNLMHPMSVGSHLNTTSPQQGASFLLSPGVHPMLPPSSIPTHSNAPNNSAASSSSTHSLNSPLLPSAAASSAPTNFNKNTARSTTTSSTNIAPSNSNATSSGLDSSNPNNPGFYLERSGKTIEHLSAVVRDKDLMISQLQDILDEREAHVKRLLEVEHKLREQLMRNSQDKLNGEKLIAELQQKMRADHQMFQENMKSVNKTKEIDIHQWQATTEKYKNELHVVKDELTNVKRELTALKLEKTLTPNPTASLENMHAVAAAFLPSQNDILALEARVKTAEDSARTSKGELEMERKKFDKKLNKLLENRQQLVETNVEITNHCEQFEKALETLIQKNEIMEREKTSWQEQMSQKDQMVEKLTEQLKNKKSKQSSKSKEKEQDIPENSVDLTGGDEIEDTPIGIAVNKRGRPRKRVTVAVDRDVALGAATPADLDNATAAESATIVTTATSTRGRKRKNGKNRPDDYEEEEKKEPSDLEVLLQAQKEKELLQQQQNPQAVIPRRRGRPQTTAAAMTTTSVRITPRFPPAAFAAAAAASNAAHANAIVSPVASAIVSPAFAAIASPLGPTPMSPQFAGSVSSSRSLIAAPPINTPLMALTVKTRRGRPPKNLAAAAATTGTRQLRPTISNLNTAPVPPPTLTHVTAVKNILQASIASAATMATVRQPAKKRTRTAEAAASAATASQVVRPQQSAAEMELELFGEVSEEQTVDPFAAIVKSIASNWINSLDIVDEQMSEHGVVAYSHPIDQILPMLCKNIHQHDASVTASSSSTTLCSNAIPRLFSSLFSQLVSQLIARTGGSEMEPIFLSLKASNKLQLLVAQFIRSCRWMVSQIEVSHVEDSADADTPNCSCLPHRDFQLLDALSDLFYQSLLARKNDHILSVSQAAIDCAHLTYLLYSAPDSVQIFKATPSFYVGISVIEPVVQVLLRLLAGRLLAPLHLLQHFLFVLSTASNAAELKKLHPFHREYTDSPLPSNCEHIATELSKLSTSSVWQRVFDASSPDSLLPAPQLCSACCHSRPILSSICHIICRKLVQPYLSQSLQMRCPQLVHFVNTQANENEKSDQLLSSVMLQLQTYEKYASVGGSEHQLPHLLASWSLLMSSVGSSAALLLASEVCIPLYEKARSDSKDLQARLWQQAIGIVAEIYR